jgi:hypothetical protein
VGSGLDTARGKERTLEKKSAQDGGPKTEKSKWRKKSSTREQDRAEKKSPLRTGQHANQAERQQNLPHDNGEISDLAAQNQIGKTQTTHKRCKI